MEGAVSPDHARTQTRKQGPATWVVGLSVPCLMAMLTRRTMRYGRAWLTGPADYVEEEVVLDRAGTPVPATVVRPRTQSGPFPGWVVMHGITRPGRAHEQLVRFTRAMASSGLMTIVPEVPEWRELDLAPSLSAPTIKAAIAGLRTTGSARDERVGVIGFSFGAPHAIAAAGSTELRDEIAGTAGFGGYCSLESTFRFMMTGVHEWGGREHFLTPDRYGRWIVAANYLTSVPGHEDAKDVADALRQLAINAGDTGAPSWHPCYDPVIRKLRERVEEPRRHLFDLFAPMADAPAHSGETPPGSTEAPALAEDLSAAARRVDPSIDPFEALASVDRPVHLLHGRNDHLIPFSEAYRLRAALPSAAPSRLTVTRLFGHSGQDPFPFARAIREVPRFVSALDDLLALS